MIDKLSPNECALCGSCADACPTGAISFQKAYLDFRYPSVDSAKCISCGLCERVCPVLTTGEASAVPQKAYAAKNPDREIRRGSSSGGVFWALAKTMLSQGGYVCGAVFDEEFRVHHLVSNREEDVRRMMGSKYAQSDLTGVYKRVKELLRKGETVLFTGCPCQVAGLHRFLGREYEKLITVDIVCHGTPSNTMLRAYLDHREKQYQSKIEILSFRDKKYGWHRSAVRMKFSNGAEYCMPYVVDPYTKGFLQGIYLKESCYDCRFKNFRCGSDLTMGDFWGAEIVRTDLDDNVGLSAVIAHTAKADALLQQCGLDLWEENLDTIIKYNPNLIRPTRRNPNREAFYDYAQANGYVAAIEKLFAERPLKAVYRKGRYALRCIWYWVRGRKKPLY